jgi:hypothetical protein
MFSGGLAAAYELSDTFGRGRSSLAESSCELKGLERHAQPQGAAAVASGDAAYGGDDGTPSSATSSTGSSRPLSRVFNSEHSQRLVVRHAAEEPLQALEPAELGAAAKPLPALAALPPLRWVFGSMR